MAYKPTWRGKFGATALARTKQGPRPARRAPFRMGQTASAPPQNASPYGLRWGFAPAVCPIRNGKGTHKNAEKKTNQECNTYMN